MKKISHMVIGVVLSLVLLFGAITTVRASDPVCGGKHIYDIFVRDTGWWNEGEAHTHTHNGQLCFYQTQVHKSLWRCACGAEKLFQDDIRTVHSVN